MFSYRHLPQTIAFNVVQTDEVTTDSVSFRMFFDEVVSVSRCVLPTHTVHVGNDVETDGVVRNNDIADSLRGPCRPHGIRGSWELEKG